MSDYSRMSTHNKKMNSYDRIFKTAQPDDFEVQKEIELWDYSLENGLVDNYYTVIDSKSNPSTIESKPRLGILYMIWSVLGLTFYHIFAKVSFYHNPRLTNYDCLLFVGIVNLVVFFSLSIIQGVSLRISGFSTKTVIIFIFSLILAVTLNALLLSGLTMLPVGKSVLIFDINPMLTIIFAAVLLGEKLEIKSIISTLGALAGIYVLTLSKGGSGDNGRNQILLGTLLILTAAVCQALILIVVRFINIANVHHYVRPWYVGLSIILFCLMTYSYNQNTLTIGSYGFYDVALLTLSGVGCAVWIGFQNIAFKYHLASKLAPLNYAENVFTLLADFLFFGYTFVTTDILGILMVVIFITGPTLLKGKPKKG